MTTNIDDAVRHAANLLAFTRHRGREQGASEPSFLDQAIERHDTAVLYRSLMDGFSYQGISDAVAQNFVAKHGNSEWSEIQRMLEHSGAERCPKLESFHSFSACGYRKSSHICANMATLPSCPVPTLPLRKGVLNQQAFALYLLIRDICGGDLVQYIDQILAIAKCEPDPVTTGREALLALFTSITGVSRKLASMMLATILLAASNSRQDWTSVGSSMVAIDSLVHNHLHRTGILRVYCAEHRYGEHCAGNQGCERIVRDLAARLGCSTSSANAMSPRQLQHAIWRFCAGSELNICNGNRMDDKAPCRQIHCPVGHGCARMVLKPLLSDSTSSFGPLAAGS
ncbi:hypothetical protein [Mesorhizobium sp. CN2-181]|uniref:hypothetical protein n=1 Tax=Mesorhizobium yinganensis TaxID=3157707 RepID=UPI0032B7068E